MEHRNSILLASGVSVEAKTLTVEGDRREGMQLLDAKCWSNRQSAISLVWALRLMRWAIGVEPSESDVETVGSVLSYVAIGQQYLDADCCFSPSVDQGIRATIARELCVLIRSTDSPLRRVELRAAEEQSADVESVTEEWVSREVHQPSAIGAVTGMWETSYNLVSAESLSTYVYVLLDFARWALTGAKSLTARNSAGRLVERLVGTEAIPRGILMDWIRETRILAPTTDHRRFIEHSTRQQS